MRGRTWSACVVLAWGILLIMTTAGPLGSVRSAQANIRIASSIGITSNTTSTTHTTLTGLVATTTAAEARSRAATGSGTGTKPDRYLVQPGNTLSGIAAAAGVRGGWPALYAANRAVIGPDPGLIRPGTVLTLPGRALPARYTIAAGDTLSGIAAALGSPGGWPALYAANRLAIGANPNAIRVGLVLTIPRQHRAIAPIRPSPHPPSTARPRPAPTSTQRPGRPTARPSMPTSGRAAVPAERPTHPASAQSATIAGLPRWLEIVLLAAGVLILIAFLTEPTLTIARRLRAARPGKAGARIVLADYDRLVVTHCGTDGKVYVLRPPDADPEAILLAARLVLAQDRYEELAGHLGVRAHWPRE